MSQYELTRDPSGNALVLLDSSIIFKNGISTSTKIMGYHSKLFFSLNYWNHQENTLFLFNSCQYMEPWTIGRKNPAKNDAQIPSFYQGAICQVWSSRFGYSLLCNFKSYFIRKPVGSWLLFWFQSCPWIKSLDPRSIQLDVGRVHEGIVYE